MKKSGSRWLRYTVQIGFLAFLTYTGYMHQKLGGGAAGVPAVDALCPLGGAESIYMYLKSGTWLRRTAPSSLILFVSVALMTLLAGRVFCGWICPLGTIGEWSAKLGKKLGIKPRNLPDSVDRPLRMAKYLVLTVAVLGTWMSETLFWRGYDPWVAWMHLSAGMSEIIENPWSYVVLFVTVIGASFYVERFWCRYLCPLGALLGFFQKFSLNKVRRDEKACINCHFCSINCPIGLDPESKDVETSADCIACGECVEGCPASGALRMGTKKHKVTPLVAGIIGLVIFFGVYGAARTTGLWQTSAPAPSAVKSSTNPADQIYGWMTLDQVSKHTNLSVEKLIEIGDLPQKISTDVSLKKIEEVDDHVFIDRIKTWFDKNADLTVRKTIDTQMAGSNPDEIRGSMTATEIGTAFGVDPVELMDKAGWDTASLDVPLKEIAKQTGAEVQQVRDAVKELIDK